MLRNIFVVLSPLLLAQRYIVQHILYSLAKELEIRIATAVVYNQKVFVMAACISICPYQLPRNPFNFHPTPVQQT